MLIKVEKTIEVNTDVEITQDDIIREFMVRQDHVNEKTFSEILPVVFTITRILAGIPDEVIAAMPDAACETLCERLMNQASRYDRAV